MATLVIKESSPVSFRFNEPTDLRDNEYVWEPAYGDNPVEEFPHDIRYTWDASLAPPRHRLMDSAEQLSLARIKRVEQLSTERSALLLAAGWDPQTISDVTIIPGADAIKLRLQSEYQSTAIVLDAARTAINEATTASQVYAVLVSWPTLIGPRAE
jgi:hypothetical protein